MDILWKKVLVCYFSATGTTKRVAEEIAKSVDGDLFEIEPVEKYTSEDLDWTNKSSRSTVEMEDVNSRPSIVKKVDNLGNYKKVIVGFPVWWYREPSIIDTFMEENKFDGKSVYVFVTSGGSTVAGSFNSLKNKYNNVNFVSGKRFSVVDKKIKKWIGEA